MARSLSTKTRKTGSTPPKIASIAVENLFGHRSFRIEWPEQSRVLVLYGDNGVGKSTILRLLFAILFPSVAFEKRDLVEVPFSSFAVSFTDGTTIKATKTPPTARVFTLTMERGATTIGPLTYTSSTSSEAEYDPTADIDGPYSAVDKRELEHGLAIERAIKGVFSGLVFVTDRRRALVSRGHSSISEFVPIGRTITANEPRIRPHASDALSLSQLVQEFNQRNRRTYAEQNRLAEQKLNDIYVHLIDSLSSETLPPNVNGSDQAASLASLAERMTLMNNYGLSAAFDPKLFMRALVKANPERKIILEVLISSYLDAQSSRLAGMDQLYRVADYVIAGLNNFLVKKHASYTVATGLIVEDSFSGERVPLDKLSSGEKQLLYLFLCSAHERSAFIIVDEPELSLNAGWQRELLSFLVSDNVAQPNYYIFATHSTEIAIGNAEKLVRLEE